MKRQFSAAALSFALALAASCNPRGSHRRTFTGSAAGRGLDLAGDFDYAVTMNRFAP